MIGPRANWVVCRTSAGVLVLVLTNSHGSSPPCVAPGSFEPGLTCQQRHRWHLEKNATQMISSEIVAACVVEEVAPDVLRRRAQSLGVQRGGAGVARVAVDAREGAPAPLARDAMRVPLLQLRRPDACVVRQTLSSGICSAGLSAGAHRWRWRRRAGAARHRSRT